MDVKLMPFEGAGFKPAATVNGKNDTCLGGFIWLIMPCEYDGGINHIKHRVQVANSNPRRLVLVKTGI
jgi:hypothetical protein